MKSVLKGIRSLEIEDDLNNYWPEDPQIFGSWVRVIIGPDDQEGAEFFDMLVCTPKWLQSEVEKKGVLSGKGTIILDEYDYDKIILFIKNQLNDCCAEDWAGITQKLSLISFWEYEDYKSH